VRAFRYRALDAGGVVHQGHARASGLAELDALLAGRGLELLRARPSWRPGARAEPRLPRPAQMLLLSQLEQLLRAGLPMLEILTELARAGGASGAIARALGESIAAGLPLSAGLARFPKGFDPVLVSLVRAGEESGSLPALLRQAVADLRWQEEQLALTRRVLLYPALVGGVLAAALSFLLVYVVPQLAGFLTGMGQSLPPQTRALLACAEGLKAYGLFAGAGLGLLTLGAFMGIRGSASLATAFDGLCLRLPLIGTVLGKLALGRMCRVCAVLYAAGIPLPEALRLTRGVLSNRALRTALVTAGEQIDAGAGLHDAFAAAQIFPDLLLRMLRVGEHSGRLDEALGQVAECFASEARETVARLQTLLNPALVGVLGLVLLWIVWAVFEPLYGLLTHLRV